MAIDPSCAASWVCEKCVEPICKPLLSRCQSTITQRLDSFLFLEGNYRSLEREKEDLETKATALRRNITMEENMLKECDEDVELLDQRIEKLQGKIASTGDDYKDISRCLCGCTPNLFHRYRLGKRVSADLRELRVLIKEAEQKGGTTLAHRPLEGSVEELERTWTVGMTSTLNDLKAYLHDEHRRVIGIYGTGGVGKSTLLREFNNEFLKGTCGFQVIIFVTVSNSDDLNVTAIQKKISERLDLPWDDNQSQSDRAISLTRALRRKSFVLLLDDVWKPFNLEVIGIPQPGEGIKGKLILASRSLEVCTDMGAHHNNIKVKPLKAAEAWSLFRNNLGPDAMRAVDLDSEVKRHAEAIVEQCQGLPLALNVIGKAVASMTTVDEWSYASRTVKTSPAGLRDVEKKLLSRLEFSYTMLGSDLKPCFLYCSLFPEDYSFRKDQLVEYWMAEGLIAGIDNLQEAYETGHYIIRRLKDASLLESGDTESEVKMHDIIRDMALWVASSRGKKKAFLVQAGTGLTKAPKVHNWELADRISLMNNSIQELHDSPRCNTLLTLLLQKNPKLDKLPHQLFQSMPSLRVLDLSYTRIKEIPIGNGTLPELRYLNLQNTRIITLPNSLGSLKKLICLDLSRTYSLVTVPSGMIAGLPALQVLNMYSSHYGKWRVEDGEISENGVQLKELEELKELEALGITVQSVPVLRRFFEHHTLKGSARYLSLEYCEGLTSIKLSDFRFMTQLRELSVHSCHQLTELLLDEVVDQEDGIREETSLEVLTLAILSNLRSISAGYRLSPYLNRLRELIIKSCPKLENLTWVLQLHSLERLMISDCKEIEQIIEEEKEAEREKTMAFSKLGTIILKDLPKLESICYAMSFPALKFISVQGCPNLRKLPFGPKHDAKNLQKIFGYDEWWKELDWEGGSMTSILGERDIFVPI